MEYTVAPPPLAMEPRISLQHGHSKRGEPTSSLWGVRHAALIAW